MSSLRTFAFLLLAVLAAFAARVSNLPFHLSYILNSDAAFFLNQARDQLTGGLSLDPLWPPLYPLASAALAGKSGDLERSALTITLVAGSLLPVPIYVLARSLFGTPAAAFAATGAAALSPLVFWSCQAYPETLFILMVLSLLGLLWPAGETAFAARYLTGGLLLGAAYLVRPEGFIYLPLLIAWIALDPERGLHKGYKAVAAGLLVTGFLVVSAPQLLKLRAELGHWSISGKGGWNLLVGDRVLGKDYDQLAWSLTEDGKEIASHRAMRELRLVDVLADRPGELARRYALNSRRLLEELRNALDLPLLALAVVGLVYGARKRRALAFVLLALAPLAALPVFFINSRFLVFSMPIFLILAAHGAHEAAAHVASRPGRSTVLAAVLLLLGLLPHVLQAAAVAIKGRQLRAEPRQGDEFEAVGHWMRANVPENSSTTNVWVAYHAGLRSVQVPLGPYARVLSFLKERGCDYLVVDRRNAEKGWLPESSPAFAFLLHAPPPGPELREVYRWNARPEHEVRVFEILQ